MKRNNNSTNNETNENTSLEMNESEREPKLMSKIMARDLKIYGNVIQSFIAIAFLGMIAINFFNVSNYCQKLLESNSFRCSCVLEKCHYYMMGISLAIINVITLLLMAYDYNQYRIGAYRLNDYFLYFLAWSGGWIPIICMFAFTGYKQSRNTTDNQRILKLLILFSVTSVTSACLYVMLNV